MPAWFLVGGVSLLLTSVAPDSVLDTTLFSWTGNFIALVVSAALNVAAVYFVMRRFSKP
jgi:membrane protein implicated in regulation of membrane protease activity